MTSNRLAVEQQLFLFRVQVICISVVGDRKAPPFQLKAGSKQTKLGISHQLCYCSPFPLLLCTLSAIKSRCIAIQHISFAPISSRSQLCNNRSTTETNVLEEIHYSFVERRQQLPCEAGFIITNGFDGVCNRARCSHNNNSTQFTTQQAHTAPRPAPPCPALLTLQMPSTFQFMVSRSFSLAAPKWKLDAQVPDGGAPAYRFHCAGHNVTG